MLLNLAVAFFLAAAAASADDCRILNLAFRSVANYKPDHPAANYTSCRPVQSLSLAGKNLTGAVSWAALANLSSLESLDVSGNSLSGSVSGKLWRVPSLRRIDLSKNGLGGALRFVSSNVTFLNLSHNRFSAVDGVAALTELRVLDLSSNRVRMAPPGLSRLRALQWLDLSGNKMAGIVPDDLPPLAGLQFVNLSHNNFSGKLDASLVKKFGATAFVNCGSLKFVPVNASHSTTRAHPLPPAVGKPEAIKKRRISNAALLSISIVSGFFGSLIALGIIVCFVSRSKNKCSDAEPTGERNKQEDITTAREWVSAAKSTAPVVMFERPLMALTFADLMTATSGFGDESRLADHGARNGAAYRAVLPGDMHVVVRVVEKVRNSWGGGATAGTSEAGSEEDVAAAAACRELARLRHPNLLPLLGYCIAGREKLLLYEYMQRGDLHRWLHELPVGRPDADDTNNTDASDWPTRHHIALGVARGLAFLHAGAGRPLVHGHLVPTNVLLDDALEPRISDFGNPDGGRPEDDVYSFGLVLLELMTARSRWDEASVAWARVMIRDGRGGELLDPRLRAEAEWDGEMAGCLRVGYLATAHSPEKRPRAQQLVGLLKDIRPSASPLDVAVA